MPNLLCHKCGFNNPPGMRFCGNCGTRLPLNTSALVASAAPEEYLPETVGVMVGADLLERFRVAGLNSAGQRRTVTILFADLSGFTALSRILDPEEVFVTIQQFMNLLIKDVYKYDGMVDKMLGDGLMAIFGAPIAHESHPELALRSAVEMMEEIRQFDHDMHQRYSDKIAQDLNLSMHISLNSGEVVVGGIGSNMLMNYTAIGDTVNLASRLLDAATPGVILVSDSAYQHLKVSAEFQPVGPFWLKGYDQPVSSYQFVKLLESRVSDASAHSLRSPMVGRDEQLGSLIMSVDNMFYQGLGGMTVLYGEAGIGKSRLISEFRQKLIEKDIFTIAGHSYTYKKTIQYWVLQDMLRHYLNITGNEQESEMEQIIRKHVKPDSAVQYPEAVLILRWILGGLPQQEFETTFLAYLDPEQLQREVFTLAVNLLFYPSRQKPIVLIFEDMHWADESSLQFLQFAAKKTETSPVLLLVVTRNPEDPSFSKVILPIQDELGSRYTKLELTRLDEKSARVMVNHFLKPHKLPNEFIHSFLQRGNGNPFYIEELIHSLVEQGWLLHDGMTWKYNPPKNPNEIASIPDSIQGLILSRFDRLSSLQRRLLQVASIIGRDFNSALLRDVLKISDPLLFDEIMQQLIDRGLLEHFSDFKGQDYRFTHILMSDTIYGTLLSGDKCELHGLIGQSLESLHQANLDEYIDVLARHYFYSLDGKKALEYCIRAGKRSAEKFALEQARSYYLQSELLMSKIPHQHQQAADVYSGLGQSQLFHGEYQLALESFRKAAGRMQEGVCSPLDYIQLAKLHRSLAEVYEKLSQYEEAITHLTIAQNMVKVSGVQDSVETVWLFHDLGWVQFRQGNLTDAEYTLQAGLKSLPDENQQPALYASICNRLAGVYYQQSKFIEAARLLEHSIALRERLGDRVAVARSSNNLGLLQWKMGSWSEGLQSFGRSLKSHRMLGDVEGEVNVLSNLGLLEIDRGDFPEAETHLLLALEQAERLHLIYHTAMINLHLSRLFHLTGRFDDGLQFTKKGTELFDQIHSQEVLPDLKVYEGLLWLDKEDLQRAKDCAEEAIRLIDIVNGDNKITDDRGRAYRLLSQIAIRMNDFSEAENCILLSDEIFQHTGDVLEQGRNLVIRGQLSEKMGDDSRSEISLNRARQIFEHYGAMADLAEITNI